ncbi:hypothetical protein [Pseudoxanthomonas beigongshangi]
MAYFYAVPFYSRNQVKAAGKILVEDDPSTDDIDWANEVLVNWRASHAYPLNTFQATLRNKLKKIDEEGVVGERLKRLPSVVTKLKRFKTMTLPQMQDIAGLRAVVGSTNKLIKLAESYTFSSFTHELVNHKNYVLEPKADGYRSIHYVYRYYNPRTTHYDGLHVELQMRTKLQHAWATAVETVDAFLGQTIKAGAPSKDWARFFLLASAAFAQLEKYPLPPGCEDLSEAKLLSELKAMERKLKVMARLSGFRVAANQIHSKGRKDAILHLVVLDLRSRILNIKSYSRNDQVQANEDYSKTERRAAQGASIDAVLVSGSTLMNLKKAYPNYYLDTQAFVSRLGRVLQGGR